MAKNDSDKSGGFPNWRGRSGLDPVDTSRVQASVDGIFLRRLFTFKLRTHNIISLFTMLIFGVAATALMLLAIYQVITEPFDVQLDLAGYIIFTGFYLLLGLVLWIGVALLINFVINVGNLLGFWKSSFDENNRPASNRKEVKKKMPKRRKDYK